MDSAIPLAVPNAEGVILPSAADYIEFRRKYPRLGGGAQTPAPMIPFIAAAHEHAETFPVLSRKYAAALGAETFEFNVPSYGYIRAIWLDVNMSGGSEVAAEYEPDAPFNAIQEVTLLDTNGAPIFGPLSGFNTFLSNLYGGYAYQQDIRNLPTFNAGATSGNFRFQVRIPIEISHHDGTGCIGNQNASAPYRIRLTMAPETTIYKKSPGKIANQTLTISPILEAWSLPNQVDAMGRPQSQLPPNYGTVQYWSERVVSGIVVGNNNVQVLRVGNLLRNVIFVGRETSATGKRADGVAPEFPIINWDARQLFNETSVYRQTRSYECLESLPAAQGGFGGGRPTGVFAYTFDRSNQDRAGDDKPWLWLPTVEATRLEWTGSFTTAGVAVVLINDVAPAEVNPAQRYALPNATGFAPNPDFPNPNQA